MIAASLMAAVSYFSPALEGYIVWQPLTKVYWLVWLIVLAAICYFGALFALGFKLLEVANRENGRFLPFLFFLLINA